MLRRIIRQVVRLTHLIIGLSVLPAAGASALSGLMLLFEPDLVIYRLPELAGASAARPIFMVARDLVTIDQLASPGGWDVVRLPDSSRQWFDVWLASGERAYLIPGQASFTDRFRPGTRIETLAATVHTELMSGSKGARAVAWSGVTILVLVVSGYGLWLLSGCPPVGSGLRRRPRRRTGWLSAHMSFGVAAGIAILAVVLTGVAIAFPGVTARLLADKEPPIPEPTGSVRPVEIDWPVLMNAADTAYADDRATYVFAPRPGANGVVRIQTRRAGEWEQAGLSSVLLDPNSAAILALHDGRPSSAAARVRAALHPVHAAQGTARDFLPLALVGGFALLGTVILAAGAFVLRLRQDR